LQGQVTGNVTSQSAPNAVPGYGGADLPQGQYLSNPNSLAGDGAVAAITSQPYAIVTNPNRPTVDTSTLGLTSAKQVESSPTSYTGIAGSSQGNCQPIPASSGTASTYYDSCQIGTAEADSNFTCTIGWANQFTSAYQYTCHSSEWDIYNPNTGGTFYWGIVDDCGSFASQSSCTQVGQTNCRRSPIGRPAPAWAWSSPKPTRPTIAARRPILELAHRKPIASTTPTFALSPRRIRPGVPGTTYVGPIQTYQGSTVDNADCQAKLKGLPTGETCLQPTKSASMPRLPPAPSTASRSPMIAGSGRRPTSAARSRAQTTARRCRPRAIAASTTRSASTARKRAPVRSRARSTNARPRPRRRPRRPIPAAATSIASMEAAPSFRPRRRLIWPRPWSR
jgi:conjugal transfer mating pair stabilization protein TraN